MPSSKQFYRLLRTEKIRRKDFRLRKKQNAVWFVGFSVLLQIGLLSDAINLITNQRLFNFVIIAIIRPAQRL